MDTDKREVEKSRRDVEFAKKELDARAERAERELAERRQKLDKEHVLRQEELAQEGEELRLRAEEVEVERQNEGRRILEEREFTLRTEMERAFEGNSITE